MTIEEAKKKYKDVIPKEILNGYKDAAECFFINIDDPDLKRIKISLPDPPDWHLIEGWGLEAKDQIFKILPYPEKLKTLKVNIIRKLKEELSGNRNNVITEQRIIAKMWQEIEDNKKDYRKEIKWIKTFIWHKLYGYWFFCNGTPTYINGYYFKYLNDWYMKDVKLPEYRDANRREFLFNEFAMNCTQDADATELGYRICMGTTRGKVRRNGNTNMGLSMLDDWATTMLGVECGIQSYDKDNAKSHYIEKYIPAFDHKYFFLKPMWTGSATPQSNLVFRTPTYIYGNSLGSKVTFATSASRDFYNGKKTFYMLLDEAGQTKDEDVLGRHNAYKNCISTGAGSNIHGFMYYPSTVIEADEYAIKNFKQLCDSSKYHERTETKQTLSGLFTYFIPAYDGLEGFIDKYGQSIIEDPTEEQKKFINKKVGAKKYIESQLEEYKKRKDFKSYYEFRLQHPTQYSHCFAVGESEQGFNTIKIKEQEERVDRMKNPTICGTFKWQLQTNVGLTQLTAKEYLAGFHHIKQNVNHRVVWCPDAEDTLTKGRSNISINLPENQTNCKEWNKNEQCYFPSFPKRFISSADCYQWFEKSVYRLREDKSRLSLGGGCVFQERDFTLDPEGKAIELWQSYRPVCDYYTRPDDSDEFAEEMLMMSIYFGSPMFPEINIKDIYKWFVQRGYKGFLLYGTDILGNIKDTPGFNSQRESKEDMFKGVQTYVENYFHLCRHIKIINEVKEIKGKEDMTNHDLFTAFAGCLLGSKVRAAFDNEIQKVSVSRGNYKLSDFHRKR